MRWLVPTVMAGVLAVIIKTGMHSETRIDARQDGLVMARPSSIKIVGRLFRKQALSCLLAVTVCVDWRPRTGSVRPPRVCQGACEKFPRKIFGRR